MRLSIVYSALLFGAALAAPLNSPSDEGIIPATTGAVTTDWIPISKTNGHEGRFLDRRDASKDSGCVDVLRDHGRERVEKRICNEKDRKAFQEWSQTQADKDDADVLMVHQYRVLRWADKKMGMRNNSLSLVYGKDIHGKKIPIRQAKAGEMLENAAYWSPKKWLKKYKKEVKILNGAQELFDQQRKNTLARRDVSDEKEKETTLSRRGASAKSDCVDVTYDHGVGVLTRRLCTKKEKKEFQKWEQKQMEKDHIFIHMQHVEREMRWLEKKIGLRKGAFSYSGGRRLRDGPPTKKDLIDDYRITEDAKYMTREKWLKKYKKQAEILDRTQELDDTTNMDDKPLERRDVPVQLDIDDDLRDAAANTVPGSPVPTGLKHDVDPVATPKQGERHASFNMTRLRSLFERLYNGQFSPGPVQSEVSSPDDSVVRKAFLDGVHDRDSGSDIRNSIQAPATPAFASSTATATSHGGFSKRAVPSTPGYESDYVFPTGSTPYYLLDLPTPAPATSIVPKISLNVAPTPAYQFSLHPDFKTWPYTTPYPTTTTVPGPAGFTPIMGGSVWVKITPPGPLGPHGQHSTHPVITCVDFATETLHTIYPSINDLGRDEHGPRTAETRPYPEEMSAWSKAGLIGPKASSRTRARIPNIPTTVW